MARHEAASRPKKPFFQTNLGRDETIRVSAHLAADTARTARGINRKMQYHACGLQYYARCQDALHNVMHTFGTTPGIHEWKVLALLSE